MTHIAVIGGGPAGYIAAIAAIQNGSQVTLVEEKDLGGTCLNVGCIPTKALLQSAEIVEKVKNAPTFGIELPDGKTVINWEKAQGRKGQIVKQLVGGIGYLMKKNKITVKKGSASFLNSHMIVVQNGSEKETIQADKFIIASGSEPVQLPFAPFDGEWVVDSTGAMNLRFIPKSMVIVGGGVIGCEFASLYSRMGTAVTMIEMADRILPGEDIDISNVLRAELEKHNVMIWTGAVLKKVDAAGRTLSFEQDGNIQNESPDCVLISVGRKPRVELLNLEKAGVQAERHGVQVNESMQTNVPHIYACGDVIGGVQLAHVAFHEGKVAAHHASGKDAAANYRAVPRCVYTSPEIASVGLTEAQARAQYGEDIRTGEFSFAANGKALISGEPAGKVKVIVEPEVDEIVGLSIVGPHATELIGQGALMINTELTTDLLHDFIAAHPTLSEAIHEALLDADGQALHQ